MNDKRGSNWRRWDLHIHTPETIKNDQYAGETITERWDNFYKHISDYIGDGSDPMKNIAVLGITDYYSIDNYLKVIRENRIPDTVKMILPNVEMRLELTGKETPINIHFIFDPDPDFINSLNDRFFSKLTFSYSGSNYSATKNELIRFGKSIDKDLDDSNAYKKGVNDFLLSLDNLRQVFKKDPDLRKHTIIGVANKTNDGVSGLGNSANGQTRTLRNAIYEFVDVIFSSQPSDIDYFSGRKSDSIEELIKKYGRIKPCIHGCDAHSLEKIFEPDLKRYCWIKSDPTFEGLLQIIYEPLERVRIQTEHPNMKDNHQIIDNIQFIDENFQNDPIYFNDSLNCIIGGKSTGKSLLLHQLALNIDKSQVEEKEKVVKSTRKSFDVNKTVVNWKDGTTNERKIIYIPQTFLNNTMDNPEESTAINKIIEGVVLQDSMIKEEFDKLIEKIKKIRSDSKEAISLYLADKKSLKKKVDEIREYGESSTFKETIKQLSEERDKLSALLDISEKDIEHYTNNELSISIINAAVDKLNNEKKLYDEIGTPQLILPNCPTRREEGIFVYDFSLFEKSSSDINKVLSEIQTYIENKWNEHKESSFSKIDDLINQSQIEKEKLIKENEPLKEKITQNDRIKTITKQIETENSKCQKALQIESERDGIINKIKQTKLEIINTHKMYLDAYREFVNIIKSRGVEGITKIVFSAEIVWKKSELVEFIEDTFNKRSVTKFNNKYSCDISDSKSIDDVSKLIENIWDSIDENLLVIKAGKEEEEILNRLYSDMINIHYVVKYDNDVIEDMSPGKKSLVLLELLINLEKSKCPILIDQPEDDLDNRSIYEDLVKYIKDKKKERQIIVVTHNANVVLGADAEEVIIANQHAKDTENTNEVRFEYRSGAIENIEKNECEGEKYGILYRSSIQKQICDILEGGKTAFKLRESKYSDSVDEI